MRIAEMLDPRAVVGELRATSKREVIDELAEAVAAAHPGLAKARVVATLLDREKLGSTGVGEGIAIPHGKLPGLPGILLGFGRSLKGVHFDAIDGRPVQLLFLLLAPEESPGTHLKALARISRLLKDPPFRQRLLAAGSGDELLALIRTEDEAIG
jgi:PTS system nitrogen regulatory IIA component